MNHENLDTGNLGLYGMYVATYAHGHACIV